MLRQALLGVRVDSGTAGELTAYVCEAAARHTGCQVLNVNVHCLNLAWQRPWLREMLEAAAVVFCDGDGVRLGARLAGRTIEEKITYNRWIWQLAAASELSNVTWYLVGATPASMQGAVRVLRERYPRLRIVGHRAGFFDSQRDVDETVKAIAKARPGILIVGMGMPRQEQWLAENWRRLDVGVALTGGAVFDYLSGVARMTPDWAYRLKLEWLFRLCVEPKRLWRRYLVGNSVFLWRMLWHELLGARLPWDDRRLKL